MYPLRLILGIGLCFAGLIVVSPLFADDPKPRLTLNSGTKSVWSLSFSADGKLIAAANGDGNVTAWEVATGRKVFNFPNGGTAVALSPDGKTIALSEGKSGEIKLHDVKTGSLKSTLTGHKNSVYKLIFGPDGTKLASVDSDKSLKLWDTASGQSKFSPQDKGYQLVGFAADGRNLFFAQECSLKFIDVATGLENSTPIVDRGVFAMSANEKTVAVECIGILTILCKLKNEQQRQKVAAHYNGALALAVNPSGDTVASSGEGQSVKLWDAATGNLRAKIEKNVPSCWSLGFSPDGELLACGGSDGVVSLWEIGR